MDRRQAQDLDNWITGHYGEDQLHNDCPTQEEKTVSAKEWTEESLTQAIAEEGLAFVVRGLNVAPQLLEALQEARSAMIRLERTQGSAPWARDAYGIIDSAIKAAGG